MHPRENHVKVLLLCSAFNGLSQRAWIELRGAGHDVRVQLAGDRRGGHRRRGRTVEPDLIICPFLRGTGAGRGLAALPDDHHPSRSDGRPWAVLAGLGDQRPRSRAGASPRCRPSRRWTPARSGATGPSRSPADPPRKSSLYNGPVADAAIELVREVVAKAADPAFAPRAAGLRRPDVLGRLRPAMRQADRAFSWSDPTADDRAPDPGRRRLARCAHHDLRGARCRCSTPIPARGSAGVSPAPSLRRRHGAVLVRTGDGAVWIGQVRAAATGTGRSCRPTWPWPTTSPACPRLTPRSPIDPAGHREISYRRHGPVGVLTFDFYNGAMSTGQCRRLAAALAHAAAQDTRVLVDPRRRGRSPTASTST